MNLSNLYRWLLAAAFVPVVAGCSAAPVGQGPGVTVANMSQLPPPERTDLSSSDRPYYLGPHDKIQIDVFGVEDLRRLVQVDAAGMISFPLAGLDHADEREGNHAGGVVQAGGRTPGELATEIENRLRGEYVRNPQVTVNLEETVSQVVTVDGQVKTPGLYPVIGRMTLARAVARAGGVTELARLSDVIVLRNVGGQQYAGVYNLQAIRRGNYPDPEVFASDVIMVGDSPVRRWFREILNAAPLLQTPLILLTGRN